MHVSSVLRCSASVHLQYFDEVHMCRVKNATENFVEKVLNHRFSVGQK